MEELDLYNGDCLVEMDKLIADGVKVDAVICDLYLQGNSARGIAVQLDTNHKMITKILHKNNIEIRKPLNLRGKRKFSCRKALLWNNMVSHIRFNVDMDWVCNFEDFEKVKFLNKSISKRGNRYDESDSWYKAYIEKFYDDKQFNKIYTNWLNNKTKYLKPSIDHKIPRSKGGDNSIDNLQFLTWFENRCKNDMSQQEWDKLKQNIKEYLI